MKISIICTLMLFQWVSSADDYKSYDMNPPAAKARRKAQVERMPIIREYKMRGFIGEHEEGILAVRDLKDAPKEEHAAIKKVVEDENADRRVIFNAIVKANKLTDKEKGFLTKSTYEVFRNTSAKETWYYEKKNWHKKYD